MPPKTKLAPLEQAMLELLPVRVGERVAFPDTDHQHAGMYGIVEEIGVADGGVRLDVRVFDPFTGVVDGDAPLARITLGEIQ